METKSPVILGLIVGLSLIASAAVGGYSFYKVRSLDNTLGVTGSTTKSVKSDLVKWQSSFSRTITLDSLKSGYTQMKHDQDLVIKFFKDNGIAETDINISAVSMNQNYNYNQNSNLPVQYVLLQNVQVQSADIDKITALSKNIQSLIDSGVIFSTQSVDYYYTKLPDLRIELLGDAMKDARTRASQIAESAGQHVGALKSAASGVVQVMQPNSTDVSDYGSYDTQTIDKQVMVTVKATFVLN